MAHRKAAARRSPSSSQPLPSPARTVAYETLLAVESGRGLVQDLLQHRRWSELHERDRSLAAELVLGVLRWRGHLDWEIARLTGREPARLDAEVATILRLGLYQIEFLTRVPKFAAVNEAVELTKAAGKRSASGLVNAVLRKCQPWRAAAGQSTRPREEILAAALRSIPAWLLERWRRHFSDPDAEALALASVQHPPVTLRVVEGSVAEVIDALAREGVEAERAAWAPEGLIVRAGNLYRTTVWREGRVVLQDEASQLIALLVAPSPGQHVLDLCAAPGMKTAQLAAALGCGTLVAADKNRRRLRTMQRLLQGRIPPGVRLLLLQQDAAGGIALGRPFDRILLDAPCSGTGTLARNPDIKLRLQPDDLPRLAALQQQLLVQSLQFLAPQGRLVYATCSLEVEENEQVIAAVLRENPGFRLVDRAEVLKASPGLAPLLSADGFFRTRPHLHGTDGFFAAVLTRT